MDFSIRAEWLRDPKHLVFSMARYKFVAKMLHGFENVLEVGAGDGVQGLLVERAVKRLVRCDLLGGEGVLQHDMVKGPFSSEEFEAVYSLDVLEHIRREDEERFMVNLKASLAPHGTCIIGMPSLESQVYASPESKSEHVNCKTEEELREAMKRHFRCVYIFGMNDETLHTGFGAMAHYRLAVCNTKI